MGDGGQRKRQSGREKTLSQFRKDESGRYRYAGSYQKVSISREAFRRKSGAAAALSLLAAGLSAAAGCVPDTGMDGLFYCLLPYAAGLILDILTVCAVLRMIAGGGSLRGYIYDKTVKPLTGMTLARGILGAAGLAGLAAGAYLGAYKGSGAGLILFVMSQAAGLAVSFFLRRILAGIAWEEAH